MSDPAREAADCGATVRFFDDQPPAIVETDTLLADKSRLNTLEIPDPSKPGRLQDRVQAAALFRQTAGDEKLIEGWVEGPCAEGAGCEVPRGTPAENLRAMIEYAHGHTPDSPGNGR